jgi:hypothetical protein
MAMNAILNTAGIVAALLPLATFEKPKDPARQTTVSLGVGLGAADQGSIPLLNLFDRYGNRVSQYGGDKNGHIGGNDGATKSFTIDNSQNGNNAAEVEYVSIVMSQSDGICLSAVVLSTGASQWIWTGDVGFTCGAQWYASRYKMGGSNRPIRCVWLDADHGNNIVAQGLSLHMTDFTGEAGLLAQYKEDEGRLCQNSARMTFHPSMDKNGFPTFFNPPLDFKVGNDAADVSEPSTDGALTKPDQGKDREMRAYPDGTTLKSSKIRRGLHGRRRNAIRGIKNIMSDQLTVSHETTHSAKELCTDSNSLGPDFVSIEEGLFCDMETAKLWPLCTATTTFECFDLQDKAFKSHKTKRDAPIKNYKVVNEWK